MVKYMMAEMSLAKALFAGEAFGFPAHSPQE
jgi:hypothetical protein